MDENFNSSLSSETSDLASNPQFQQPHPAIRVPKFLQAPKRFLRRLSSLGGRRQSSSLPDPAEDDSGNDYVVALEIQRQLDEEAFERKRMVQRRERRLWYEYYLRPFSMVVLPFDLIHRNGSDGDTSSTIQDDTEDDEIITDCSDEKHSAIDSLLGDDQPVCLRLPTEGRRSRIVDGTCALCLDDYCVGEVVVWSSCPDCKHAFHKECFMQWASKGKKRCPVCRHWFVPGQRIETQKIVHGEAWTNALAEMERAEEEEEAATSGEANLEQMDPHRPTITTNQNKTASDY